MNGAPIGGVIFKAKKANSQTSAPIRGSAPIRACPDTRDSTVYIEIQIPIYDVIKYKMEPLFVLYSIIDTNIFNKQVTHRTSVEKEQGDIIVK